MPSSPHSVRKKSARGSRAVPRCTVRGVEEDDLWMLPSKAAHGADNSAKYLKIELVRSHRGR